MSTSHSYAEEPPSDSSEVDVSSGCTDGSRTCGEESGRRRRSRQHGTSGDGRERWPRDVVVHSGGDGDRGDEGAMERGWIAHTPPAAEHGLSEAASDGVPECHTHERSIAWCSPRGRLQECDGQGAPCTPAEVRQEAYRRGSERTKGADGEDGEAHPRGQGTVLRLSTVAGDSHVPGEADAVGVVGVAVGGAGCVQGLDVNQAKGARSVKTNEDDVRAVT